MLFSTIALYAMVIMVVYVARSPHVSMTEASISSRVFERSVNKGNLDTKRNTRHALQLHFTSCHL